MIKLAVDENIYLELASPELSKEIFDLVESNREELGKWLNWVPKTKTVKDVRKFLKKNKRFQEDLSGAFAIYFQGKLAGLVDLHEIHVRNNKSNIGYWLDKNFYGKGIMTGSVAAILNYAFKELGINRIAIEVAVGNVKSKAVAERLGFKFEGIAREANKMGESEYLDLEQYSLLRREWAVKNN